MLEESVEGLAAPVEGGGETQFSPNGQALHVLMEDLDCSSLVDDSEDVRSQSDNRTESVVETEEVTETETVVETQTGRDREDGSEASSRDNAAESAMSAPTRPRWIVSKTTSKAGRAKVTQAACKKAVNVSLQQTSRFVNAVASGMVSSLAILQEAVENGATYKYVEALRALSVLQQDKRAK